MTRKILYLLLIATFALPLAAQEKETSPELQAVGPILQRPQFENSKVYEVRYRNVNDIAKLMVGLDGNVVARSVNTALRTITVSAQKHGHEIVEELLRKYDVPYRTIEFQFYLINASTTGEGLKNGLPEDVHKALNEVASLTRYKSFELIDTPFIRTTEGKRTSASGRTMFDYKITLEDISIEQTESPKENKHQIRIGNLDFSFIQQSIGEVASIRGVSVPALFAEGEMVVIGASQMEKSETGTAIITIVSARVL